MTIATTRLPALVALLTVLFCTHAAYSMGEILGESKEQLKLEYELKVHDHGTGRVTAVLTISDAGRLKPLDGIQLVIPKEQGNGSADLTVDIQPQEAEGKLIARVHLKKEWAQRAEIWLTTRTLDGESVSLRTRFHFIIPVTPPEAATGNGKEPASKPAKQ